MIRRATSMTFTSAKPVVKVESVHGGTREEDGIRSSTWVQKIYENFFHNYFYVKEIVFTNT